MVPVAASPSCPRCGAESPAGESRCGRCGFGFVETAEGRRLPRPNRRAVALAACGLAAAGVAAAALRSGGDAAPQPPSVQIQKREFPRRAPSPVPALEAERRLELRYGGWSDDETAAVRCPHRIDPNRTVRCELRYPDGIPRALLVRLSPLGELETEFTYPATVR